MSDVVNLVGKQFSRLTVIRRAGSNHKGRALWLCLCECGTEKIILGHHITRTGRQRVRSCGCLRIENRIKHGAFCSSADLNYQIRFKLLASLKSRCQHHGYESDLTLEDIPQIPPYCPVLGIEIKKRRLGTFGKNRDDNSVSLDRVNPNLPYLKKYRNNLRIISWRANRLKSNGTVDEFEKITRYMRNTGTLSTSEKSSLIDSKPFNVLPAGNEAQAISAA